ncbi:unnamed protein product [Ranitomeya imitator]|uniref:Transposase Tc1-like domain-containing protein n=1 Tax=Ranitomeya imitator TaxID=111125 RepID=A0ABN9KQG0_9NEOB|nr:unnamed protein product [Ranitomeya imitator]
MEKRKKTKELSEDLRNQIVRKHEQSQGYKSISRDLNVPASTVRSVIKKCKAHGTVANLPRCRWKRKIDKRFQHKIVLMLNKEPRLTSKQVQAALQSEGTTVSTRTIRRRLNEKGLYGRRPRKTPLLTPRHKKARLEFAKTYLKKPKTFWKNVLWSDETKGYGAHIAIYYVGYVHYQMQLDSQQSHHQVHLLSQQSHQQVHLLSLQSHCQVHLPSQQSHHQVHLPSQQSHHQVHLLSQQSHHQSHCQVHLPSQQSHHQVHLLFHQSHQWVHLSQRSHQWVHLLPQQSHQRVHLLSQQSHHKVHLLSQQSHHKVHLLSQQSHHWVHLPSQQSHQQLHLLSQQSHHRVHLLSQQSHHQNIECVT